MSLPRFSFRWLSPVLAALLLAAVASLPAKGEPPLTAQTQKSGGPRPAEQTAVVFDHADLAFEVLPKRRRITGVAFPVDGGQTAA